MPRLSMWNPIKTHEHDFIDGIVAEHVHAGGTGVYVHKLLGNYDDGENTGVTVNDFSIQDVLFLENRDRKYDSSVYELRAAYNPGDSDFDLTQFGLFLSNDNLFMTFHLNSMVDSLGRKLMPGDVIELPHLRDDLLLDGSAINRFFVVEDGARPSEAYDARWWPHLWRVKMKTITDSQEYRDILGTGENEDDLRNILSTYQTELAVSDAVMELANADVPYHPHVSTSAHLYFDETVPDKPGIYVYPDDGSVPPNGVNVVGTGASFPDNAADGDYFLRTDYVPNRLFKKEGTLWKKISDDNRAAWNAANRVLQTFINNDAVRVNTDGTTGNVKTNLSQVIKPRTST